METRLALVVACAVAALTGGCGVPAWQRYEESLYTSLKVPGPETYAEHTQLLAEVLAEAQAENRTPPPGVFAEYGFYLARTGRASEAKRYFEAEKAVERTIEGQRAFSKPEQEKP
jgi:hypothetical protein